MTHSYQLNYPSDFRCAIQTIRSLFFVFTLNCRRSHTFRIPSSPPDRRNGSLLFQLITLTSDEWASLADSIELGGARMSQIRIDWSTEHDAKTCGKRESAFWELKLISKLYKTRLNCLSTSNFYCFSRKQYLFSLFIEWELGFLCLYFVNALCNSHCIEKWLETTVRLHRAWQKAKRVDSHKQTKYTFPRTSLVTC